MNSKFRQNGVIHLVILVVAIVIAVLAIAIIPQLTKLQDLTGNPLPSNMAIVIETPSPTIEPTPTPTLIPTPVPTLKPTATPTPTKTPTPTTPPVSGPPGSGYSVLNVATVRGNFSASIVSFDAAGTRMVTDTASDSDCANDCPTLPLGDYISRNAAFAGINGTYFCPPDYASCSSKKNSFDFPVYNTRLGRWINQGNLFWNDRSMIYQDGGGYHFMRNANGFGGGLTGGIVNSPGLVENGNVIADQFPLTDQQRQKGTRGGIGIRGNIIYLVIARNADMIDFGYIFKSLGADFALNLDGGGSTALWFGGYKAGPGRSLPNAVIFAR